MASKFDNLISAGAWNDLRDEYSQAGGEDADDFRLAEILRVKMNEVEGL